MVGKLIGKAGETIKHLQMSTGSRVQIDHQTPGDTKRVSIFIASFDAEKGPDFLCDALFPVYTVRRSPYHSSIVYLELAIHSNKVSAIFHCMLA